MARSVLLSFTSYITNNPNSVIAIPGTHHAGPFVELQQSMPSRTEAISPFIDQLMRFIHTFRVGISGGTDIEIAIREAISNAVIHGNKNDGSKRVDVVCRCGIDGEVFITVRDEGAGIDFESVPDPTTSDNLLSIHGRGIYLMRADGQGSFRGGRDCCSITEATSFTQAEIPSSNVDS